MFDFDRNESMDGHIRAALHAQYSRDFDISMSHKSDTFFHINIHTYIHIFITRTVVKHKA